jgi:hypothetical protein
MSGAEDNGPNQMHFHLAFYQLSQIMHQMMKSLYLNVDSKNETWETIRSITEGLQEMHVLLPKHLQAPYRSGHNEILQNQAVFFDLVFSHINIVCCRPLLVQRQSDSDAVAQRRWSYCREIAQNAANRIAANIEDAQKCGHLARMLYSVSGLWLNATEVQALQAIVSPRDGPMSNEAIQALNQFLALFTHNPRPSPQTAQMMAIVKDCIRVVMRINSERHSENSMEPGAGNSGSHLDGPNTEVAGQVNNLSSVDALNDFLNHGPFLSLPMDDMIWMPENPMVSGWGNINEWNDLV